MLPTCRLSNDLPARLLQSIITTRDGRNLREAMFRYGLSQDCKLKVRPRLTSGGTPFKHTGVDRTIPSKLRSDRKQPFKGMSQRSIVLTGLFLEVVDAEAKL